MNASLAEFMSASQQRLDKTLHYYLKECSSPAPVLQQAMAYGVFNGGKRIRPLLVYLTGYALNVEQEKLDAPAAAVELIHSYSLIHDDLPAMDNADLRRGKPSCHKAYGEAIAILAGDAMQALVFHILATHKANLSTEQRLNMITTLSLASGPQGIAAGQALDMDNAHQPIALNQLLTLYHYKTGVLLSASVKLGLHAATKQADKIVNALESYAELLGTAFQIQDDLLDIECNTEQLGKPQGIDQVNHKVTYPSLVGVEKTKQKIAELVAQAIAALAPLGAKNHLLVELADYLLYRLQ
jgi:geranylgeranyl pyrophosphate synthase